MIGYGASKDAYSRLRRQAEAILKEGKDQNVATGNNALLGIIHELEIHQIELDLQNEELRRTAKELEAARDEYFDLYHFAPVGFVTLNEKGKIEQINEAAANMLNRSNGFLEGQPFSNLIHPDYLAGYFNLLRKSIGRGFKGARNSHELKFLRKDGKENYVRLELGAGYDKKGRFRQWRLAFSDITSAKQAEADLRRAHDTLEEQVKQRTAELDKKKLDLESLNKNLLKEIDKRKKFETELKDKAEKVLTAYRQRDILSKKLVDLLEKERHEISNTLHDQVGQILAGIAIQLEGLKAIRTEDGSALADRVEPIQDILRKGMTQTRKISYSLRSDVLEKFGLIASIKNLIEEVQKLSGLRIHLFTKNISQEFKDMRKSLTIYRVIQESLTNAVKYAKAKEVFISLNQRDKFVFLTIEDDGKGFNCDNISDTESFNSPLGITIMRERVSMAGGDFRIESKSGKGTHIHAQIPLDQ